jgi:hypothetical protein
MVLLLIANETGINNQCFYKRLSYGTNKLNDLLANDVRLIKPQHALFSLAPLTIIKS